MGISSACTLPETLNWKIICTQKYLPRAKNSRWGKIAPRWSTDIRKDTLRRVGKIVHTTPITSLRNPGNSAWKETPSLWEKESEVSARLYSGSQHCSVPASGLLPRSRWLLVGCPETRPPAYPSVSRLVRTQVVPGSQSAPMNPGSRWELAPGSQVGSVPGQLLQTKSFYPLQHQASSCGPSLKTSS